MVSQFPETRALQKRIPCVPRIFSSSLELKNFDQMEIANAGELLLFVANCCSQNKKCKEIIELFSGKLLDVIFKGT